MPHVMQQLLRRLRTSSPRRNRRFQASRVDYLETRVLPTAVVTFTGAAMSITSDTSDNFISVTRIGNQVLVDANGGLITVAGSDVPSFLFNLNGAFNLTAKFSDGNDIFSVAGGLQLKSATVAMGDGLSNQVIFADATLTGKLTINTEFGADIIFLQNTSVTGTTVINTGWNSDILQIIDSSFTGAATINTDLGSDQVVIIGAVSRTKFGTKLTLNTGDDEDVVQMIKVDTKALSVDLGQGLLNQFIGADILLTGGLTVKGSGGTDAVALVSVVQSGTGANLIDVGAGTDIVQLSQATLTGATTVNVGSGANNAIAIEDVLFNNTFTFTSQGTADVVAIEQGAGPGATTFTKAAKFTFGISSVAVLSSAGNQTNFLSSVSFTGRTAITTISTGPATSFAIAPVLKNVLLGP